MNSPSTNRNRFEERLQSSSRKVAIWVCLWVASIALLAFGPRFIWNDALAVTLLALVVNVLVGLGVVFSNKKHLSDLDELHRKVMFDAMAITLGVALVISVPWSLLEGYGVIAIGDEIAYLLILMGLTFVASVFLGLRRYR